MPIVSEQMPPGIANLNGLTSLHLDYNHLTEFPVSLCCLGVVTLDMHQCLSGAVAVPEDVGNMQAFKVGHCVLSVCVRVCASLWGVTARIDVCLSVSPSFCTMFSLAIPDSLLRPCARSLFRNVAPHCNVSCTDANEHFHILKNFSSGACPATASPLCPLR